MPGICERRDRHAGDHLVTVDQRRSLNAGRSAGFEQGLRLRRSCLDQLVRLSDTGQEVAHPMRRRIKSRTDELDRWPSRTHFLRVA